MGASGVIKFGDVRIAGLSGIYKDHHFDTGFFERHPLERGDVRSIYHVRRTSVWKLAQIREHVDIVLSHDWPLGIARMGDLKALLDVKKFLRKEVHVVVM